jgi:hypothetical protein
MNYELRPYSPIVYRQQSSELSKNMPTNGHAYYLKLAREYWTDFWATLKFLSTVASNSRRRGARREMGGRKRQRPEKLATD